MGRTDGWQWPAAWLSGLGTPFIVGPAGWAPAGDVAAVLLAMAHDPVVRPLLLATDARRTLVVSLAGSLLLCPSLQRQAGRSVHKACAAAGE